MRTLAHSASLMLARRKALTFEQVPCTPYIESIDKGYFYARDENQTQ